MPLNFLLKCYQVGALCYIWHLPDTVLYICDIWSQLLTLKHIATIVTQKSEKCSLTFCNDWFFERYLERIYIYFFFFFNVASGGLYFSICLLWQITITLRTGYGCTHEYTFSHHLTYFSNVGVNHITTLLFLGGNTFLLRHWMDRRAKSDLR